MSQDLVPVPFSPPQNQPRPIDEMIGRIVIREQLMVGTLRLVDGQNGTPPRRRRQRFLIHRRRSPGRLAGMRFRTAHCIH
jgi:hypothetical protein